MHVRKPEIGQKVVAVPGGTLALRRMHWELRDPDGLLVPAFAGLTLIRVPHVLGVPGVLARLLDPSSGSCRPQFWFDWKRIQVRGRGPLL